jgi:hypothetical protein
MFLLFSLIAFFLLSRGAWLLWRLVRSLPCRNDDFRLE